MDASLKQRLIGAVVIVALAVIFIPMLFDGSGSLKLMSKHEAKIPALAKSSQSMQTSQQIAGRATLKAMGIQAQSSNIPSRLSVNSVKEKTSGQYQREQSVSNINKRKQDLVSAKMTSALQRTSLQRPANVAVSQKVASSPKSNQNLQAIKMLGKEVSTLDTTKSILKEPVKTQARVVRVRTHKKPRHHTQKKLVSNAVWAIQLASFSKINNAKKLLKKLRHKGYAAYMKRTRMKSGVSYARVFVGPHSSRATASKLLAKLKKQVHLQGVVIAYQPKS